jgi:hypothetical protein
MSVSPAFYTPVDVTSLKQVTRFWEGIPINKGVKLKMNELKDPGDPGSFQQFNYDYLRVLIIFAD